MQLTRFTDLGLRVMIYLTYQDRTLPVTIGEIARQFDVPHSNLSKVVSRMANLGWVQSVRGRNGGLGLAPEAQHLRLGFILRNLEETSQLIDCAEPACVLKDTCLLKGALDAGLKAFYAKMDEYTLADVCKARTAETVIRLHQHFLSGDVR